MARIRTIKPEFPHSETIGKLSRDARLLFIQLWTIADDEGRARASSRMLASLLYPYDDDVPSLISSWLNELVEHDCIVQYQIDGNSYLQISNWLKHQKIDRPSKSRFPPFDDTSRSLASIREDASTDLGPRTLDHIDDDASARASPKSLVTQEAIELSDRIAILLGFEPKEIPPSWCGATFKVQAWLSGGWNADLIYASCEKQMALRAGKPPPSQIIYFEKGIADFIAQQSAPLPKGNTNKTTSNGGQNGQTKRSVQTASADLLARVKGFDDQPANGIRSGTHQDAPRLLSKG